MENKKLKLKIIKNAKKDFVKPTKIGKTNIDVLYSRFKAVLSFLGTKIELEEGEWHSHIRLNFGDGKKIVPSNRKEYGTDFITADGRLVIMKFKLNNGERVITDLQIMGGPYEK